MSDPSRVAVLGSTGSIGTQALEVIGRNPDRFEVVALTGRANIDLLVRQCERFGVAVVAVAGGRDDEVSAADLRERLAASTAVPKPRVLSGPDALPEIAGMGEVDTVVNAVVGAAGLRATMAALDAGKRLAIANKESLVAAGPLVTEALARGGGELVPIDSEHAGLAQCLRAGQGSEIARLIITGSGGPFRGRTATELEGVTVEEALAHPTWRMGAKITIDSATLMNKGLESIEAHVLFGVGYDRIEVVIHPQSIVHGMVEFCDGSTVAQLSHPTMEGPIGFALGYPDRLNDPVGVIDWSSHHELTFEPPDLATFRCLSLAVDAGRTGGLAPAVLNAANEEAVHAFIGGQIGFPGIAEVVESALGAVPAGAADSLEAVLGAEEAARAAARDLIAAMVQT